MSALSDALSATQARAVAALAKRYVGGTLGEDQTPEAVLASIGLADPTDTAHLIAAWDFLRESGAEAPAEQKPAPKPQEKPASDAQWARIRRDCDNARTVAPDGPLTMTQASEIIQSLEAGTYDSDKWTAPF